MRLGMDYVQFFLKGAISSLTWCDYSQTMPDKKPLAVRILLGLIIFKIIIVPAILTVYFMTGNVDASSISFAGGLRMAINDRFGIEYGITAYSTGYLIGKLAIPLLISFLLLIMVLKRNFVWTLVGVSLDLLVSLVSGMPILPIVMLVMVLTSPTKSYLRRKDNENTPPPVAPLDYELIQDLGESQE